MTLTTDQDENTDTRSPWLQPKFVVSAVVVALIAVLGLVLALLGPGDRSKPTSPAARGSAAPPAGATSTDSFCGLPAGDQTVPRVAPAATRWKLIGSMAAPTAPATYGPGATTNGIPTCFAHSPTGALYAAVNFVATSGTPGAAEQLVEVAATGPGKAAALQQATQSSSPNEGSAQLAGFNFLNYSPTDATVDLLFRGSTGSTAGYAHFVAPLIWVEGTWKWSVPPSGNPYENTRSVPDSAGYVAWAGA